MPSSGRARGETVADDPLDGPIGVGHGGAVGLRRDLEVDRAEPIERDRIRSLGELQRERQIGGEVGHGLTIASREAGLSTRTS